MTRRTNDEKTNVQVLRCDSLASKLNRLGDKSPNGQKAADEERHREQEEDVGDEAVHAEEGDEDGVVGGKVAAMCQLEIRWTFSSRRRGACPLNSLADG